MNANPAPAVRLALGGGTARGAAHVGVLKGMEREGIQVASIAGTSFGSIIASMSALGAPPLEIERVLRELNVMELWAQSVDFGLHRAALIHGERFAAWLDRTIFYGARMEDAQVPLAIATAELHSGALRVLRSGPVADAVRASCALPGIFGMVERDGVYLVDGGFVEPVPFAALIGLPGEVTVGVHTGLELSGSQALARLRALDRSAPARWLHAHAARLEGRNPWSRLVKGLSLSLRSYRNDATAPAGASMIYAAPPIAWWDFHRSPIAIEVGERAFDAWLEERRTLASRRESEGRVTG